MADLLSSGREPGAPGPVPPRRRWTTPLAGVLVVVVAGGLAVRAGGRGDDPPAARDPLSVVVRPPPTPLRTGPPLPDATYRLDADPGPGPAGLRLLVGGRHPGVLDARTGRLTTLSALLDRPYDVVTEVVERAGVTVAAVVNQDRLRARGVVLTGTRRTDLGPLLDLLPLRDGTVLTQDCAGGGGTGPCRLTGRTATGGTVWRRTVARRLDLVRDTPYGLLVRAYQGDLGGVARLEDPRTGAVRRVLARTYAVLAADDRQLVFVPAGCDSDCGLVLTDLAGLTGRFLPVNPGRPAVAAFSPDGGRLAIGFAGLFGEDQSPSPERDGYALVLDLTATGPAGTGAATGAARRVPGVATGPTSAPLPVWAPDGRLVLGVSDGSDGRVVVWTPGAARVTVLPTRLSGFYGRPGMIAARG